ncbi:SH2 domain-containing protein 4A [Eublepharis macularius]|uniref:SH2 domain-containing protein 4A n=1 Tax=Eublepharis macularius TaxID=481883 RepID=A0AA97JZG0_EUBMA|nr:SH2 domain-containing protein 4A [Eublepharis macularius]
MLKQILSDMYVDPELLAELSEEQKQILFFKMRQEQIRRWKDREAAATLEEASRKERRAHERSVQWKLGADGDVWVWVMGEHSLDKPYHLLCGELIAKREKRQLLQEAEALRGSSEARAEPSAASPLRLTPAARPGMEGPSGAQEGAIEAPAAERASDQEGLQTAVRKSRGVEEMLADSISQSWKYYFQQQRKETQTRTTMKEHQALNPVDDKSVQNADKEDAVWQESLKRSKAADERRRSLAKQARDDYKRLSLQGKHKGRATDVSGPFKTGEQRRPLPPPPPLPPKPKNLASRLANGSPARKQGFQRSASGSTQESIIQWFKEEQLPLRAGFEKATDSVAPWFHGILTTKNAEDLLSNSAPGTFLIRVSEKIQGYVLSYRSAEGYKHFLIDASGESCSFLGVDRLQHSRLADLVEYHKDEAITSLGKELLLYPCGQQGQEPDYLDLFE